MSFLDSCEQYFNTRDFYEILKIKKTAKPNDVKKAYHKASLVTHPDRVAEEDKSEATEKFKAISRIYSILSDSDKRQLYDETGSFDEETSYSLSDWLNLWRSVFKPITRNCIDNYKATYLNSDTERRDIQKAYLGTKGNMTEMQHQIPFLDVANEDRIIAIVREMVDAGEVPEYKYFFNEPKAKKQRRIDKEKAYNITDDEAAEIERSMMERQKQRAMDFATRMADLEATYCKKSKKVAIKGTKPAPKGKAGVKNGKVTKRSKK